MDKIYAYIDESGSYGFDFEKEGNQNKFVVAAIIVKEKDIPIIDDGIGKICKQYFGGHEIKSNRIKTNHKRRKEILGKVLNLPFNIFSLVVDKRTIFAEHGITKSKKYFYEFLNDILYRELRLAYPKLSIVIDGVGSKDFATEFKKYVDSHRKPVTLFDVEEFAVVDSMDNCGVQLADLIAGTLAYVYDEKKKVSSQERTDFLGILNSKLLHTKFFPLSYDEQLFEYEEGCTEFDKVIFETAYRRAQQFIDENENSDNEEIKRQLFVLKYLFFRFKYNRFRKYIPTKELMKALNGTSFSHISEQVFRTRVIGKLRDKGVIISSSSKGYKLPSTVKEITDYYQHVSTVVLPMLHRLSLCENALKLSSNDSKSIITPDNFKGLFSVLEAIKQIRYI